MAKFLATILLLVVASVVPPSADSKDTAEFGPRITEELVENIESERTSDKMPLIGRMTKDSERIYLVEFRGFENDSNSQKDCPRIGTYQFLKTLKGPYLPSGLRLRFEISKLDMMNSSSMPSKGSRWIIYMKDATPVDGVFRTYNDIGRVEYSKKQIDKTCMWIDRTTGNISQSDVFNNPVLRNGESYVHMNYEKQKPKEDLVSFDSRYKADLAYFKKLYFESESILIGEYQSCIKESSITRGNPPIAIFKTVSYLKGQELTPDIRIRFAFPAQKGLDVSTWQFKESMMPEKGSKWILYIPRTKPVRGAMDTYKGAGGRIPYEGWTVELALRAIEMIKGGRNCSGE